MDKKEMNQERINVIKKERYELLKEVRENIINGNENVIDNSDEIIRALNYDETNIKKYDALKEAQGLIEILTKEILKANTKEERDSLRRKLNYYINKIKNEAKKRNIDYSKYMEKVTTIRKDISKYVRLLKKEDQSYEIDELNYYYDFLTDEEKKDLAKKISNARNYNTRVKKAQNVNTISLDKEVKVNPSVEPSKKENEEIIEVTNEAVKEEDSNNMLIVTNPEERKEITLADIKKKRDKERKSGTELSLDEIKRKSEKARTSTLANLEDLRSKRKFTLPKEKTFSSDEEFISSIVKDFDRRYNINETIEYDGSFGKNMISFVRNIPVYSANKKMLKRMMHDYSVFHHGVDLGIYMEYLKKDNSIREGLRRVFHNSSLYSKENEYINNHERCVSWILSVVRDNDINLNYRLAK